MKSQATLNLHNYKDQPNLPSIFKVQNSNHLNNHQLNNNNSKTKNNQMQTPTIRNSLRSSFNSFHQVNKHNQNPIKKSRTMTSANNTTKFKTKGHNFYQRDSLSSIDSASEDDLQYNASSGYVEITSNNSSNLSTAISHQSSCHTKSSLHTQNSNEKVNQVMHHPTKFIASVGDNTSNHAKPRILNRRNSGKSQNVNSFGDGLHLLKNRKNINTHSSNSQDHHAYSLQPILSYRQHKSDESGINKTPNLDTHILPVYPIHTNWSTHNLYSGYHHHNGNTCMTKSQAIENLRQQLQQSNYRNQINNDLNLNRDINKNPRDQSIQLSKLKPIRPINTYSSNITRNISHNSANFNNKNTQNTQHQNSEMMSHHSSFTPRQYSYTKPLPTSPAATSTHTFSFKRNLSEDRFENNKNNLCLDEEEEISIDSTGFWEDFYNL